MMFRPGLLSTGLMMIFVFIPALQVVLDDVFSSTILLASYIWFVWKA